MKILLDTHVLLWASIGSDRLPAAARECIENADNDLYFSAASLWEVAIKSMLGRSDFTVDPRLLRRELIDNGYLELPITSVHAVSVTGLPPIHSDPFDRLLIVQALTEGLTLLTMDKMVARYPAPIRLV